MPTASALRVTRSASLGRRMRPSGIPIRIVTPAMKPSSRVWPIPMVIGAFPVGPTR